MDTQVLFENDEHGLFEEEADADKKIVENDFSDDIKDGIWDDISFITLFSRKKTKMERNGKKDDKLSELMLQAEDFSHVFSQKRAEGKGVKAEDVNSLTEKLSEIGIACESYISGNLDHSSGNIFSENMVSNLKKHAEHIREAEKEKGALTNLMDPDLVQLKEEDSKPEKKEKHAKADERTGAPGIPMEFDVENAGLSEQPAKNLVNYSQLTKDRQIDEVKMSPNALQQLTMIKMIGFLFGIADWQEVIAPEQLLYEENEGNVNSVQIMLTPGMADVQEKMTMHEAEAFAKSLAGMDTNMLEMIHKQITDTSLMIEPLAAAVGVDAGILLNRLKTLLLCIDRIKKGFAVSDLNKDYFR